MAETTAQGEEREAARPPSVRRVTLQAIALALLFGGTLGALSVWRLEASNLLSHDLSTASQAVWSVGQGRPLVATTDGVELSRLALHVELIYALFAPLYALFPDPATLLIIQAVFYAAGALPVAWIARRRAAAGELPRWAPPALAATYLLFPVGQTAVLFGFHGDTLAMPLLLFMLEAHDRGARRSAWLWLVLSLACKFYVAAAIAVFGAVCWWRGERRFGLWTAAVAVAWGAIAFLLIRKLFAPAIPHAAGTDAGGFLAYYFGSPGALLQTLPPRLTHLLIAFGPALVAGWRAPRWLLPAVAVAVPAALSTGPGPAYDYRFHHYALPVPFLMMAIVEGCRRRPLWLAWTLLASLLLSSALVDTPLAPGFYNPPEASGRGLAITGYRVSERDRARDRWLAETVPPQVALATDDICLPRLIHRPIAYRLDAYWRPREQTLAEVELVVMDALYDQVLARKDGLPVHYDVASQHATLRDVFEAGFGPTHQRDGLLLLRRGEPVPALQRRGRLDAAALRALTRSAEHGAGVHLVDSELEPLPDRRVRLTLRWVRTHRSKGRPFAVTRMRVDGAQPPPRHLHLATTARPPATWPYGMVMEERLVLPLPPGDAPVTIETAWYDARVPAAWATDGRSLRAGPFRVGRAR